MKLRAFAQKSVVAVVLMIAVGLVFAGCDDGVKAPDDVVTSFFVDMRAGHQSRALGSVWPPTRHELEAAYEDLEAYFDGDPPMERSDLLVVTRMESPMFISRIRAEEAIPERPSDGEQIVMSVQFRDDRQAQVPLRWGEDEQRWYVDLPVDDRRALRLLDDQSDTSTEEPADSEEQPTDDDLSEGTGDE